MCYVRRPEHLDPSQDTMSARICMIAYTHYRSDARPRREAEALIEAGHSVDFLALSTDGERHEEHLGGVRVIDLPVARYRGSARGAYITSYLRFFASACRVVTGRHLDDPYGVVWVHTMPDFMVFASLPARLFGARVVLDVHDTMPELYRSKFSVPAVHPLIRVVQAQESLSCAFADHVIAVHEPHRQRLIRAGADPTNLSVVMNLPDPAIFGETNEPEGDSAADPAAPRLVYHGTIARRLGLDLAVRAFDRASVQLPGARFDIFGSGDFAGEVRTAIDACDAPNRIHFTDQRFAVDDVPSMLDGAAVGIIPNRRDPATELMLPVKLLEYVYLGIPTVAPRLPAIEHYFDEQSVAFYQPGDEESLTVALSRLLSDSAERTRLRRRAWEFTREYAWEKMKRELLGIVDEST